MMLCISRFTLLWQLWRNYDSVVYNYSSFTCHFKVMYASSITIAWFIRFNSIIIVSVCTSHVCCISCDVSGVVANELPTKVSRHEVVEVETHYICICIRI